jgi:hypothetical protein
MVNRLNVWCPIACEGKVIFSGLNYTGKNFGLKKGNKIGLKKRYRGALPMGIALMLF